MKKTILILSVMLASPYTVQLQADQLTIINNASKIRIDGALDDFLTGVHDGYIDGDVYSSISLPVQIDQSLASNNAIATASANSQAELTLDVAETPVGYRIVGAASGSATTEINSLDDNDASANSEVIVDLTFALGSDYNFSFAGDVLNTNGTGEAELELVNIATGTVFSQIISENTSGVDFSGTLQAGNYTLFVSTLSEALDGESASSSIDYDLTLTELQSNRPVQLLSQKTINFDFRWTAIEMPASQSTTMIGYGPSSYNGPQPGVIRARQSEADNDQLQIRFQEYQYLDQFHVQEKTDIMAFTNGVSTFDDGSMLVTGEVSVSGNNQWKTVGFANGFDGIPHVFLFAQSATGGQALTLHARNVTSSGFELAIKEEEQFLSSGHLPETIAYFAIYHPADQGTLMINNQSVDYRLQQLQVDHQWTAVPGAEVAIKLEEERSLDQEVNHVKEVVDVMILGDQLYAQSVSENGGDPFSIRKR